MKTVKVLDGKGKELVFTHDGEHKIELVKVVSGVSGGDKILGYYIIGGNILRPATWYISGKQCFRPDRNKNLNLTPYDKFADLKRAYSEGARIEYDSKRYCEWMIVDGCPLWHDKEEYRIKGDISIESWDKHKDVIKAYWNGAEIEMDYSFDSSGQWEDILNPDFTAKGRGVQYRVKRPEAVKMTMAEINKHFGKNIEIIE